MTAPWDSWTSISLWELRAHQLGTLVACGAVFLICLIWGSNQALNLTDAGLVGLFWLILALTFEFGFFHDLVGYSGQELLADYDLFSGCLLLLLWATTLFSPLVTRQLISSRAKK